MIDVAAEEAQLQYALSTILLLQCLRTASHPARSSLYTVPHITDAAAASLRQQDIFSLAHVGLRFGTDGVGLRVRGFGFGVLLLDNLDSRP